MQGEAWQAIAQHWLEEDPHEASRWISTLPTGGARDAAVLTMARHIQDSDPDLSWKWALTVGDPVLKIETLRQVTQSWNRRDAAAARRALENSGLSTAMQRGILTEPSTSSAK